MATISLSEAARLTGAARSTLYRAIKTGRLSAAVGPNGAVRIDPAELERVYPVAVARHVAPVSRAATRYSELVARVAELEARSAEKDERLADKNATIEDLRRRFDVATAQLGEALSQVRALTDQRPARRRWWQRGR